MRGLGDNAGWITERGEVEWTNHTGVEETEIHHVDLALMAFGDELGYPGREASHYDDGETDFWGKYGMPANEIAMGQGWIQWGNHPDMSPTLFFGGFAVQPSKAAIKTLNALVKKSECVDYNIEWHNRPQASVKMVSKERALEYMYDLSHGIAEEILDIRRRAGLCD